MYRRSIYGKRNSESCSDDSIANNEHMQRGGIQLYADRDDTGRDDLCMERSSRGSRPFSGYSRNREQPHGQPDEYGSRSRDSDLQPDTDLRELHDGSSIHSDGDGQSGSDHKLTGHKRLYRGRLQLYANRDDSYRYNLCMERTRNGNERNRRCIRDRPEHTERHTEQYDSGCRDSDLQCHTDIGSMYRHSLYGDSDGQSECNDHGTEHKHLYDGRLQLYAGRDDTNRDNIRKEYTDRSEYIRQRRSGDRANYIE